jgi:hypothetical protein
MRRALALLLLLLPQGALADGRTLVFDLYRKTEKIGTHKLSFTQKADILTVDIDISIKGKIFIIPFRYQHSNRETWRGRDLLTLDSRTSLNDKQDIVSVRASGAGYDVVANGKTSRIEGNIKSTSYWLVDTVQDSRLLNSQKGWVMDVTALAPRRVSIAMRDASIAAREVSMKDRKTFNVSVIHDDKGCLVGMSFRPPVDSTPITYRLVSRPSAEAAPDLLTNPLIAPCLVRANQTAAAQ